jgi:hypothetical protein
MDNIMKNNVKTAIFIIMKADSALIGQIIISLGSIASVFLTAQKLIRHLKSEKEKEIEQVLDKAMAELQKEKTLLEMKIQACFDENERLKESLEKEIEFTRSSYEMEVKNLGEKIESLKEEVRSQNTQILNLLAKLI